jgi:hypothetical protein
VISSQSQALDPDRPDPSLRVGVGIGGLHRRDEHVGVLRAEHVVEGAGELRVSVADEEAQLLSSFRDHKEQVAVLLGYRAGTVASGEGAAC